MKTKVIQLIKTYLLFLAIFVVQKPLFMFYYNDIYYDASWMDYLRVMLYGLKLDASVAGYLTLLPSLLLMISLWVKAGVMKRVFMAYYGLVTLLLSLIFVADLGLYQYWGFRLDSTPLFYLKSPQSALASADGWMIVTGLTAFIVVSCLLFSLFYLLLIRPFPKEKPVSRLLPTFALFLLTALLVLPIRGGISVSTMNVGKVYHSATMALNHAAINPCFSLLESLSRETGFDKQYRFLPADEAASLFEELKDKVPTDSIPSLFTTSHPNVILVVLESFMSTFIEPLGGLPDVAVRMNGLVDEGVLFTNVYANSFRTDRGLVSILSGYPAQPTTSIMKYPRKSQTLPSIPQSLKQVGYDLQYYYGGDADFTNMRSYLMSMGIERIISDKDFPLSDRMSKWGALDHIVFQRLMDDLQTHPSEPFMKIIQTSSSHEPFEVPYQRLSDPVLNSIAYTDSCFGAFIDDFKQTEYWKNTVIILVPDHAMRYPSTISAHSPERHQIPLILVGGALRSPLRIDTFASQTDIAATLLHQLGLPHDEFVFSRNILNPASAHFGYYTFPNGFGMITARNRFVFDCESNSVTMDEGEEKGLNKREGQAYLQVLYDDLERR